MRTLLSQPPTDRVSRTPSHPFWIAHQPYEIQPFHCSRVLPGDTLTNLYFESRMIWRGLISSTAGCRVQYFFFHVRATDLALDAFRDMFVDPTNTDLISSTSLEDATGNVPTYCAPGAIDWTQRGLEKIVEHHFRDEGEAWNSVVTTRGLPVAQIKQRSWLDSFTLAANMPEGAAIAGATDAGDLDRLMDAFNQLRAMGLVQMDYWDWLRSNGISVPDQDEGVPKLVAMFSEWYMPVNTVEPTDGVPTTAFSAVFKENMRKPMMFREPGFIIGIAVVRPKVLFALKGSLAGFATRAWDWDPNYLREMPEASLKHFADTSALGPFGADLSDAGGYFVDMRDDLVHGDQFTLTSLPTNADATSQSYSSPITAGGVWKYPPLAGIDPDHVSYDALFSPNAIVHDGVVNLTIQGFSVDYTPGQPSQGIS